MKKTRIISAFPASGKSYLFNNGGLDCVDSDSSLFSWIYSDDKQQRIRNPNFIKEYGAHILSLVGKVDYIFVSSHKEVREMLTNLNLNWISVMPNYSMKDEMVGRCFNRGSPVGFCDLISDKWDEFVPKCNNMLCVNGAVAWVTLGPNEYISDHMHFIETTPYN